MSNEYLAFTLDKNKYAVEVAKVQEVLEYKKVMSVPCTADYIEGIINSRGQGISVVNLRVKFNLERIDIDKNTRIIVFEIAGKNSNFSFGAVTDSVQEVIELEPCSIDSVPELGESIAKRFIKGLGKKNDEFIIILDIDSIFSKQEADLVQSVQSAG